MRKILTQEKKDKKTRRNQLIIGAILIGVMIFGTLGYAFSGREDQNAEKIDYNGVRFVKDSSEYWSFNIQGYDFITKYNPEEIENITFVSYSSINSYINKPLYIVSNFNEPNFEISRNLNTCVLRVQNACIPKDNCTGNLPIKNCSADNIVVIYESKNESESIYQEGNCVFIIADPINQIKYADAFLFKVLGV